MALFFICLSVKHNYLYSVKPNIMKSSIFLALLMAAGLTAGAQSVEKKLKVNDVSQIVYNVDQGTSTKNGPYVVKNLSNDGVWLQGNYKNNARSGNWYFFSKDNKMTLRYNYDQKKLAFVDTAALTNVSVEILSSDEAAKNNASAPLPLCSIDYYLQLMANSIYAINDGRNQGLDAEITATIATDGTASYTVNYVVDKKKTATQRLVVPNNKFAIEWIPSMYNNKPVESKFTVYATMKGNDSISSATRRFRWDN